MGLIRPRPQRYTLVVSLGGIMRRALLLFPLAACSVQNGAEAPSADASRTDAEEQSYTIDILADCAGDDPDWCETISFDASALTTSGGDTVTSWAWTIDGEAYEGAEVSHTFTISDESTLDHFEGQLVIEDKAGNEEEVYLNITAEQRHISFEIDTGTTQGDPYLFWFMGVSPSSMPGADCKQRIISMSGCFRYGFELDWEDATLSSPRRLMSSPGYGVNTVYEPTVITVVPSQSTTQLVFDLHLPQPEGTLLMTKPYKGTQVIQRPMSCTDPFPGG